MSAAKKRLEFILGLKDNASGKLAQVQKNIAKLHQTAQSGAENIRTGFTGAAAGVASLMAQIVPGQALLAETQKMRPFLDSDKDLDLIAKAAIRFTRDFNGAAEGFAGSAATITQTLTDLTGAQVARVTTASATLAQATRADIGVTTEYLTKMSQIYERESKAMGRANFAEQLAGQTAAAQKIFGGHTQGLLDGMKAVGVVAQQANMPLAEQIAVIGTLNKTMDGGEAGGRFKAFLENASKSGEKLGIKLHDANGNLLPMVDVLDKIRGKFGAIDSVAKNDLLTEVFSTEGAVFLKSLLADTDTLHKSLNELGSVRGLAAASKMAQDTMTPLEKLTGKARAFHTELSLNLTKALAPAFEFVGRGFDKLNRWLKLFPNLARWVMYATAAMAVLAIAVGTLTMLVGVAKFAWVGLAGSWAVVAFGGKALVGLFGLLKIATMALAGGVRILTLAMMLNPLGLTAALAIGLVAALGLLIYKWDDVVAAIKNTDAFKWLMEQLQTVGKWFDKLGGAWSRFKGLFTGGADVALPDAPAGGGGGVPLPGAANSGAVVTGGAQVSHNTTNRTSGVNIGTQHIHTSSPVSPSMMTDLVRYG